MRIDRHCAGLFHPAKAQSLVEVLHWRAALQPDRLAYRYLVDGHSEVCLSYGELRERAARVAVELASRNARGERALLLYPAGPEFLAAFLGCLAAGVVAIPLFPPRANRKLSRLEAVIEDSGATLALATSRTLGELAGQWADHEQLRRLQRLATDTLSADAPSGDCGPLPTADQLAFLQYTSGSTSDPKGVMVTHGNLVFNCDYMREAFSLTTDTVAATWLPHFHDMGLIEGLLNPLFVGFPAVVIPPAHFVQQPLVWLEAISRHRATHAGAPNFAFDLCLRKISPQERDALDLSSWSLAYSGAEPVREETLDRFAEYFAPCGFRRNSLYPCYGLAEATLMVSGGQQGTGPIVLSADAQALELGRVRPIYRGASKARSLVGCGHVRREMEIAIVDPLTRKPCPPDTIGEIWVSGPTRAAGYWQRPDESRETFQARLAGDDATDYLRTGDLGIVVDRQVIITGRFKDLIIIRGGNFYPQDIEWTAERAHDALRRGFSAAFSIDVDGEERLVVACEIDRQHRKAGIEQLQAIAGAVRLAIAEEFDLETHCVALLNVGAVPMTSSGKIQRQACRADFLAGSLDLLWESRLTPLSARDAQSLGDRRRLSRSDLGGLLPADRRRKLVAHIRQEVASVLAIALGDVTANTPLGALGIDSLKGNELAVRLQQGLELELAATLVWNYPTVGQIAAHVAEKMELPLDVQHVPAGHEHSPHAPPNHFASGNGAAPSRHHSRHHDGDRVTSAKVLP